MNGLVGTPQTTAPFIFSGDHDFGAGEANDGRPAFAVFQLGKHGNLAQFNAINACASLPTQTNS